MRLIPLVLTVVLTALPAAAQPSPEQDSPSPASDPQSAASRFELPVSIDKIKQGLEQTPTIRLRGLDDAPTFKVAIHERLRSFALDEWLQSADLKPGPIPAGGLYAYEMQRQVWHTADSPLAQPYAAFSEPQLLTVLIENLAGKYLGGRAIEAGSAAERTRAEARARDEVQRAIAEYCAARPEGSREVDLCAAPIR